MCGIAGGLFWGDSIDAVGAEAAVTAMTGALAHRGPDGWGVQRVRDAGPCVVFGHRRLAIIDLSSSGAQPMNAGAGFAVTYNGETYNFLDLRAELERGGAHFNSHSDTEVLLRGYEQWGVDVLARLRGMFAFGLWDAARRQLVVARDRLGIKPLYYYAADGFFLFASEVRALLATGLVPKRIDPTSLWQYLAYQSIPAPRTLIAGVRLLEPGSLMTVSSHGERVQRDYWNLLEDRGQPGTGISEASARRRAADLLHESVSAHMISDVPVGAFLSGGIDSSAVVALMRETGHCPRTFSIGFAERAFDESEHASLVARTFRTEHTHIPLRERDLLDELPAALDAMDSPTGDGVNTFLVSKAVRAQGITVALSGLGGDELFGGYPSFSRLARIENLARIWGRSPASVRSLAAATVRTIGRRSVPASKAAAVLESDGSLAAMFPLTRRVLSDDQRRALLGERVLGSIADAADPYDRLLARAFEDASDAGMYARISFAEARTYMHDVLLRDTDQMSMAHGLEVRVPLLDHVLAEYVVGLPDVVKQPDGVPKRLLVESLEGLLPDAIVHRPKQGFTLPFEPWMRGALRPFCEMRLSRLAERGFFRGETVRRMWTSFVGGGRDVSWSRIWVLVVLDAWLDRNGCLDVETAA